MFNLDMIYWLHASPYRYLSDLEMAIEYLGEYLSLGVTWRCTPHLILSTCRWCAGSTYNGRHPYTHHICCACTTLWHILQRSWIPWFMLPSISFSSSTSSYRYFNICAYINCQCVHVRQGHYIRIHSQCVLGWAGTRWVMETSISLTMNAI